MPRESAILKRTREHLLALASPTGGAHFLKTSGEGEPDLVGCVNGVCVVCETKQPGERPTKLQYARLRQWAQAGAVALWTDGSRWVVVDRNGTQYQGFALDGSLTLTGGANVIH